MAGSTARAAVALAHPGNEADRELPAGPHEFAAPRRMLMTEPEPDIRRELADAAVEPLLPIEKKLIAWSLAIGIVLLIALTLMARLAPVSF